MDNPSSEYVQEIAKIALKELEGMFSNIGAINTSIIFDDDTDETQVPIPVQNMPEGVINLAEHRAHLKRPPPQEEEPLENFDISPHGISALYAGLEAIAEGKSTKLPAESVLWIENIHQNIGEVIVYISDMIQELEGPEEVRATQLHKNSLLLLSKFDELGLSIQKNFIQTSVGIGSSRFTDTLRASEEDRWPRR